MDPIVLGIIALLIVVIGIRMFFGMAKTFVKLAVVILVAVLIWRVMQGQ
jgi:hypothetical protein